MFALVKRIQQAQRYILNIEIQNLPCLLMIFQKRHKQKKMATATATSNNDVLTLRGEFDPEAFKSEVLEKQTDYLQVKIIGVDVRIDLLSWLVKNNIKRHWEFEKPNGDLLSFNIKKTFVEVVTPYQNYL